MNYPQPGDYIDIHNHDALAQKGVFIHNNLMAHEGFLPSNLDNITYSLGIHPWFLTVENKENLIEFVRINALNPQITAIGEAGFDKLKGPLMDLQQETFEAQVVISEEIDKPLVIHCVKSWDELMASHKKLKPKQHWLVHGFRGKKELARQLISRNMYISFWFEFIVRPEASLLVQALPVDRIFLETDGSGTDIREIYQKVALDLGITVEALRNQILSNYNNLFRNTDLTKV